MGQRDSILAVFCHYYTVKTSIYIWIFSYITFLLKIYLITFPFCRPDCWGSPKMVHSHYFCVNTDMCTFWGGLSLYYICKAILIFSKYLNVRAFWYHLCCVSTNTQRDAWDETAELQHSFVVNGWFPFPVYVKARPKPQGGHVAGKYKDSYFKPNKK